METKELTFGSVCSGIEAASVAWHPLGWKAAWFSEIEPFPSAVLAYHYPDTPNLGDMTTLPERIRNGEIVAPDILCGGTPCQSFSVAGVRRSLDDARGNLSLIFCEVSNAIDAVRRERGDQPAIIFWENVPGVLNTKDNAFGCFLAGLVGDDEPAQAPDKKWKNSGVVVGPERLAVWRVLDAQYFGVAQRRRRVFVLSVSLRHPRAWPIAESLLPLSEGVRGDTAPSRKKGQEVAGTFTARAKSGGWGQDPNLAAGGYMRPVAVESVSPTLTRRGTGVSGVGHNEDGWYVTTARMVAFGEYVDDGTASAMKARDYKDATDLVAQPAAVATDLYNGAIDGDVTHSLRAGNGNAMGGIPSTMTAMQVRRLTPVECERLQGFPDNYTNIPKAADGPRYKALGNSMAVPVMAWIGRRIQQVDAIKSNKTTDYRVDA